MYTRSYMWIWPGLKLTAVMQPSAPLTCQTLYIGIDVIVSIVHINNSRIHWQQNYQIPVIN